MDLAQQYSLDILLFFTELEPWGVSGLNYKQMK